MIFVIDIGNTNVTLAGVRGEEVVSVNKVPTNREWDMETYLELIRPFVKEASAYRGAILSSVVPQITEAVRDAAQVLTGKPVLVVTKETKTGLTVALPEPDKVGRDRLVDAVWAAKHLPLPAVTADLGTATTLNVILPGNIFAGGVICAGVQTGLNALAYRAAQLPKLTLTIPDHVIGKNTAECMISGAVVGTAGMLDGLVQSIEEELGEKVSFVITGGGGEYVEPFVRHEHMYDKHMILKGLALLWELNQK